MFVSYELSLPDGVARCVVVFFVEVDDSWLRRKAQIS